jgi:hypothetical protein
MKNSTKDSSTTLAKIPFDKKISKTMARGSLTTIFGYFSINSTFRKDDPIHVGFLEDLMLLVVKGFLPMRIVGSIWLKRLSYKLCPRIVFSSNKFCLKMIT